MFKYLIFLLTLISCNKNLDDVFKNEKAKSLFILFCNEVKESDLKQSENIFIYADNPCPNYNCNITFINCPSLSDDETYGKFNYNGLTIYVANNIPRNILSLNDYSKKLPQNKNGVKGPSEFIEMWLSIKKDSFKYRKINFRENDQNRWNTN